MCRISPTLARDPSIHLGDTRDDAAGEAFDKVARLLGLANYVEAAIVADNRGETMR
ncbi:hypothetical protein ACFY05_40200 [Microtetraspora fusca]|uniref:Uncharacterized protein n=1 Tax=Microtetraspora fusca TaxID=1997 RepID=A0ABW6VI69_MICFU